MISERVGELGLLLARRLNETDYRILLRLELIVHRKGFRGAVDRLLARHVERILSIPGAKLHRRFVRATQDVEQTQLGVLKEILTYARDTEFAQKHHFASVQRYSEYRRQVPVVVYEDIRPDIERHQRGEENILFPGKPMMYNRSSGTTAQAKFIPITPYNFKRTIKDRGKLWLYGLLRDFPGIYDGKDLTLVSPAVEGYTEDNTPYGSLSGLVYQNIPEFMKLVHTAPASAMAIADYSAKVYTLIRFAMAADVTVIFTGNPSTVLNLATRADEWKESIIRDIHDGTLNPKWTIDPGIRQELEAMLEPDAARSSELERLADQSDVLRPADYWPNLRLVHTWKNGNCRLVVPKLYQWFSSETPILDFGYIASEITAADLIDPQTDGSILSVTNGFYEFVPFDVATPQAGDFLLAHQLEAGQRYYVYITTFSGLYRYDMNDVVEVVGWFNAAPVLKFLFKGKGVTSIQGEKLSEEQFIESIQQAASASGIEHDFFVGYADAQAQCYKLYIEFLREYPTERIERFARGVDQSLCQKNVEYDAKRKSERLKPLTVIKTDRDFFSRYRELRLAEGAHDGQIKWLNLSATDATRDRLARLSER